MHTIIAQTTYIHAYTDAYTQQDPTLKVHIKRRASTNAGQSVEFAGGHVAPFHQALQRIELTQHSFGTRSADRLYELESDW